MSSRLVELKRKIELMDKSQQQAVLQIMQKEPYIVLTENQNGTFINMTLLKEPEIAALEAYVEYVDQQQKCLADGENNRRSIRATFFNQDKECTIEESA